MYFIGEIHMKGLKVLASGMILFGLMLCAPKANAENLSNNLTSEITANFTQITNNKSNAKAFIDQGFELLDKKNYREAIKTFSQGLSLAPDNPYGYLGRGIAYFSIKEYQSARSDFGQSITIDGNIAYAYLFRGMSHFALGSKESAISDLETAANLFDKEGEKEMAEQARDTIKQIRNS
ncbi:tetratricopeptide repeat protein [Calothrix anomala FACHB-343]|uniref:Tetratricopeptide repeat protein n=3 Tax=Calotrichaceae TaxID=2661849 RepID=A0ABR8AJ67_9CYAN|nr:tetratricopeptide repeat protein [Calothrix parietina FACHB-288]MBD2227673.1 tetratricopeptide repeat protein [Calothrix anomala FACHB-343]